MKQMAISFGIGATIGAGFSGAFAKAGDAITEVNKHLGNLEKQKLALSESISKLNQKLDPEKLAQWSEQLKKTESDIKNKKETLEQLKVALENNSQSLKNINSQYSNSSSELSKLESSYKINKKNHEAAEATLERESLAIKETERNIKSLSDEIKINGDSTGQLKLKQESLKNSLEDLKRGYHNKKMALVDSKEVLKQQSEAIKDVTEKNKNLKNQVTQTSNENKKLSNEYNKQEAGLKKLETAYQKSNSEHKAAQENINKEKKEVEELTRQHEKLNAQIERGRKAKELYAKSNSINSAANKINSMGSSALIAGGMVAAPIAGAAKTAVSHQAAFSDVEKMFDFENSGDKAAFREKLNEMITNEKLSVTVEELYAGVAAIGQAGIKDKEEAIKYARLGTKSGIAFEMEKDQAISELIAIKNIFKLNYEELEEFTDQINTLGATTGASAITVVDFIKRLGNIGEEAGLSKAQTSAVGAVLMEMGLESNKAATGMKNLITSMTKGEFASDSDRKVFETIGMDPEYLAKAMQKDGQGTFIKVFEKIRKLEKDKQLAVLQQIFGKESLTSATNIGGSLEKLGEVLGNVQNKEVYGNSKEKEYQIKAQTLDAKIVNLQEQFKISQSKIGEALFPEIEKSVATFNVFLDKVNKFRIANPEAFSSIVKGVTYATVGLIGLGTAMKLLSPVIKLYGFSVKMAGYLTEKEVGIKIVSSFKKGAVGVKAFSTSAITSLKTAGIALAGFLKTSAISIAGAMKTMSLSIVGGLKTAGIALAKFGVALLANPITWYVAGAMALVGAGYLLYKNWDKVKETFWKVVEAGKGLWDKIPDWGKNIITATNPMIAMVRAGNWIYENWDSLIAKGKDLLGAVTTFFSGMGESIAGFSDKFTAIKDTIFDSWKEKIESWKNLFKDAVDSITEKLNNSFLGKIWNIGANIISGDIPGFAEGGVVTSPTLAMVGEGGSAESIIPHDNSNRSRNLWENTGRVLGMDRNNSKNTESSEYNINFTYAPNINGSDTKGIEKFLEKDREISFREFEKNFDKLMKEKHRRGNGR